MRTLETYHGHIPLVQPIQVAQCTSCIHLETEV